MNRVQRGEILDYVTYNERRDELRRVALAVKAERRIAVGPYLMFLFENQETVRYQVHEMMRTERIVREADIEHELSTYNELLGGPGELGCTLLIGIEDAAERDVKLTAWLDLPSSLYVRGDGGRIVRPTFDPRQVGDTRLSSVQYLKFRVGSNPPEAIGTDFPDLTLEVALTPAQRAALADDLRAAAAPHDPVDEV